MKKICIVTSSRADWGYLKPLAEKINNDKQTEFILLVTGTHLDKRYGETVTKILDDGFTPGACVEIIKDDTEIGVLETMGNAIAKVGKKLSEIKPDIVVILGDRYELFAIAGACVALKIPIAHISGGDVTYGAYDEMFRHAITKMSNIHFVGCETSRKRVIQMGENPNLVFNVGELSLEEIKNLKLLSKEEINKMFDIDVENTLLATFHPITLELDSQETQIIEFLEAIVSQDKYFTLLTRGNADTGGSVLNNIIDKYAEKYPNKLKVVTSLGSLKYMSILKYCRAVIGNSSSGIIEAPSFKLPTINIGNRQRGREQVATTVNCPAKKELILEKINSLKTREDLKDIKNHFEQDNTSYKIYEKIKEFISKPIAPKEFYNIDFNNGEQ